jgi:phosphatidate phosphatase LPIN
MYQVEFRVNGEKVDYAMKLGEGGEAFFVFQTEGDIPEDMQTSPIVSPYQSPVLPDVLSSVSPLPRISHLIIIENGNESSRTGLSRLE